MNTPNRLTKIQAAWVLIAESVADLWIEGVELTPEEREIAVTVAADLKHFAMRIDELLA